MTGAQSDKARTILELRARELAETAKREDIRNGVPVVVFELSEDRYAVEAAYVREVRALDGLTPLPGLPLFVMGLINVRGEILSVVDLRTALGFETLPLGPDACVVLLCGQDMTFGVAIQRLTGFSEVIMEDLQPSPSSREGLEARVVKGVTRDRIIVLCAQTLLNEPSLVVD